MVNPSASGGRLSLMSVMCSGAGCAVPWSVPRLNSAGARQLALLRFCHATSCSQGVLVLFVGSLAIGFPTMPTFAFSERGERYGDTRPIEWVARHGFHHGVARATRHLQGVHAQPVLHHWHRTWAVNASDVQLRVYD